MHFAVGKHFLIRPGNAVFRRPGKHFVPDGNNQRGKAFLILPDDHRTFDKPGLVDFHLDGKRLHIFAAPEDNRILFPSAQDDFAVQGFQA